MAFKVTILSVFMLFLALGALASSYDLIDDFSSYDTGHIQGQGYWNDHLNLSVFGEDPWNIRSPESNNKWKVEAHYDNIIDYGNALTCDLVDTANDSVYKLLPATHDFNEGWLSMDLYMKEKLGSGERMTLEEVWTDDTTGETETGITGRFTKGGYIYFWEDGNNWKIMADFGWNNPTTIVENLAIQTHYKFSIYHHDLRYNEDGQKTLIDVDFYLDDEQIATTTFQEDDDMLYFLSGIHLDASGYQEGKLYIDNLWLDENESEPSDYDDWTDWEDTLEINDDLASYMMSRESCILNGFCWNTISDWIYYDGSNYDGICQVCDENDCEATTTPPGLCPSCSASSTCEANNNCKWLSTYDSYEATTTEKCLPYWYGICKLNDIRGSCEFCDQTDCENATSSGCYWNEHEGTCETTFITDENAGGGITYKIGDSDVFNPSWLDKYADIIGVRIHNITKKASNMVMSKFPFNWIVEIRNIIQTTREEHDEIEYPSFMLNIGYADAEDPAQVNMLPLEDIATSESLLGSGISFTTIVGTFRELLKMIILVSFAFMLFNKGKKIAHILVITAK